ncbi:hypothetical protein QFZ28_005767 [Neobacillus niacini]|nr:hypothetical protein [Neobacillus niacini]
MGDFYHNKKASSIGLLSFRSYLYCLLDLNPLILALREKVKYPYLYTL